MVQAAVSTRYVFDLQVSPLFFRCNWIQITSQFARWIGQRFCADNVCLN